MLLISISLVVLYVGTTIWIKKELPDSISAMVYDLPEGGWRWLWTVWLAVAVDGVVGGGERTNLCASHRDS